MLLVCASGVNLFTACDQQHSHTLLRPGEQTIAIDDLRSNVDSVTIVKLIPKDVGLKVSVYSIDPSTFKVAVPHNIQPAIYKIPISAKLGEQSPVPVNDTIYQYAPIISLPVAKGSIPAIVNLTITVLEPKFSRTI
jgi:hypothetical protein